MRHLDDGQGGPAAQLDALVAALDEAGFGVVMVDLSGKIVGASAALCALVGYDEDELVDLDPFVVNAANDRAMFGEQLDRMAEGEQVHGTTTVHVRRRDGAVSLARASGTVVRTNGDALGALAVLEDLAARDRAMTEVDLFEAAITHMPVGVSIYRAESDDPADLRLVTANVEAGRMSGIDVGEFVGRTIGEALPNLLDTGRPAQYLEVIRSGVASDLGTVEYGDERIRRAVYRSYAVPLPHDAVALITENVTERVESEREIRELARRLASVTQEERGRIANDLHDTTLQLLTAALIRLGMMRRRMGDTPELAPLATAEELITTAAAELRRLLVELRPPDLAGAGLGDAVRSFASALFADTAEPHVRVTATGVSELPTDTAMTAYRIVCEALTNVIKHAQATHVVVELRLAADRLHGSVRDDGVGAPLARLVVAEPGHLGLYGMRDRAAAAGGWCHIAASEPRGTVVEFELPITEP